MKPSATTNGGDSSQGLLAAGQAIVFFPMEAKRRLRFIRRAQELGFSLGEIRELLSLRVAPTAKSADVRRRAQAKITDIEAKIRSLQSMKKALRELTQTCSGCGPVRDCPILENLDAEDR